MWEWAQSSQLSPGALLSPSLHMFTILELSELILLVFWRLHYIGLLIKSLSFDSTSSPTILPRGGWRWAWLGMGSGEGTESSNPGDHWVGFIGNQPILRCFLKVTSLITHLFHSQHLGNLHMHMEVYFLNDQIISYKLQYCTLHSFSTKLQDICLRT